MIAEDGQGVIGQSPGGNVEHAGQQLAGDLIHVGDHQQQALGSGKGGGQRAALKGAVYRAGGAGFRLHFRDLYLLAEQVQPTVCSPVVCNLRHGGGRGDGIDRRYVGKCIRNVRSCGVTIDGQGFCHIAFGPPIDVLSQ